mmetsp:Transcript_5314/g.15040  ORF Transcript_5314/g.15040 Transcript_5314/m.15040 type:complete len:215 (+) Transcript_5314:252-896(+)
MSNEQLELVQVLCRFRPRANGLEELHDGLSEVERVSRTLVVPLELQAHEDGDGVRPLGVLELDELRPRPERHHGLSRRLEEVHQFLQLLLAPHQPLAQDLRGARHEVELEVVAVALEEARSAVDVGPLGLPGDDLLRHLVAAPRLLLYDLGRRLAHVRRGRDAHADRQQHHDAVAALAQLEPECLGRGAVGGRADRSGRRLARAAGRQQGYGLL